MAKVSKKREYLLNTFVECTWENGEVFEPVYQKYVDDYQSNIVLDVEFIKTEDYSDEIPSIKAEVERSSSTDSISMLTKGVPLEHDNSLGNHIAETYSLSTWTDDFSECQNSAPAEVRDESTTRLADAPDISTHQITSTTSAHTCKICNKEFSCRRYLTQHVKPHSSERPYECSECKKKFKQKSVLKRHMGSHTDTRTYECSE